MPANVLSETNAKHLGQELRKARSKRGMTQEDAASLIGVSRTTMTAIEKGDRSLKADELIKLARGYGREVSDFLRARPTVESFEVQFRAEYRRSKGDEREIEESINELEELCRDYLELSELLEVGLPRDYPQEYRTGRLEIESEAENIAVQERNRLGLGEGPVLSLREILEQDVGLRIFYLALPPKFSEIYTYEEKLGGCMAINVNHPVERRRWSLAHGWAHFLAHRRKPTFHFEGQYTRRPKSERFAEAFAMCFLMPTNSVRARFRKMAGENENFSIANLCTLANYYGVSVEAFSFRLEGMGLLPPGTWDDLKTRGFKVREMQQKLGIERRAQEDEMLPIHYRYLAIEAFQRGLITEGRFAKFMRVNRLKAREIAQSADVLAEKL